MKCSVVILNWNGEQMLRQYLPSVLAYTQSPDVEIVVADNGSTDASLAYLQTQAVKVIQLDKNYGFAEGYNRAIAQVDAEYVVLLNSDVEVTPGWLDTMLDYMDAHPQTLAAQPKVLAWQSKQDYKASKCTTIHFEHAGAAGGMMDILGYPYCRGRLMTYVEDDLGQYDKIAPIFWATGACMLLRTRVYKDLGGLDAQFFAHQEEIDLCWRILNYAISDTHPTVVSIPQAVVYHLGGGTLGYDNPRKTYLNFRNNLLMLYKNLPNAHRWWIMIVRFFMDYLAAAQMLVTGQTNNVKAVVQARLAYHRMKRNYTLNGNKNNGFRQLTRRSIVLDFYLKGKKK